MTTPNLIKSFTHNKNNINIISKDTSARACLARTMERKT